MTKKTFFSTIFLLLTFIIILSSTPIFAASPTTSQMRTDSLQNRAATEITNRINTLNSDISKLQAVKKISNADKTNLISQMQAEIKVMQTLQTKIKADTNLTNLRADVQSIMKAYRVYWVFLPKIHIFAANDRITDVINGMNSVVTKLQARITPSLQATLDDTKVKINDAQTQGQNAVNLATPLVPDNGDKNIQQTNTTALQQARSDIKTANADLKAAYADFQNITKQL